MTIQEKPLFTEIQQFRQAWILLIILAVAAIFWCGAFIQIIPGRPFGNSPATDRVLLVFWVICGILLPVLFFSMKLTAHVRSDGIYLRFFPIDFKFQKISFSQLKSYEVRIYHPIREYGGWGIRYGRKGKAYNVSGNHGVQLEFKNSKQLLIGSQRPEQLLQAIAAGAGAQRI